MTEPADDYVREFAKGFSQLKLVKARTIMTPLTGATPPIEAPRVNAEADLDAFIDVSEGTSHVLVVQSDGQDVGTIDKTDLLRGIQGGKP